MSISYQSITSHQLYLNSGLADICLNNSYKSNMTFFFKDVIKVKKNTLEMRLSVVNAEFPVSWYLINESNNNISITIGELTTSYNFPVGNYNVNTFITKWVSYFSTLMDGTWSLTYNKYTNIFQFSYSLGLFTFNSSTLLSIIGFNKNNSYTSSGNVLDALYPFNFYNLPRINIKSSTFNIRNVDSNNRGRTRTIASVPVNANQYGGMIYYNNYGNYKSVIKNEHLQSINIEIQDDYKNYINFNNLDWTITLQVDIVEEVIDDLDTLEDIYMKSN